MPKITQWDPLARFHTAHTHSHSLSDSPHTHSHTLSYSPHTHTFILPTHTHMHPHTPTHTHTNVRTHTLTRTHTHVHECTCEYTYQHTDTAQTHGWLLLCTSSLLRDGGAKTGCLSAIFSPFSFSLFLSLSLSLSISLILLHYGVAPSLPSSASLVTLLHPNVCMFWKSTCLTTSKRLHSVQLKYIPQWFYSQSKQRNYIFIIYCTACVENVTRFRHYGVLARCHTKMRTMPYIRYIWLQGTMNKFTRKPRGHIRIRQKFLEKLRTWIQPKVLRGNPSQCWEEAETVISETQSFFLFYTLFLKTKIEK